MKQGDSICVRVGSKTPSSLGKTKPETPDFQKQDIKCQRTTKRGALLDLQRKNKHF